MTQIIAERNNVLFQFEEDTTSNRFVNATSSGILISAADQNQSGVARWAKVTHIGEQVEDVKVGEYILLEPGRWTSGFYVDGQRYWKTDVDQILATSDEPYSTY
jgi:co-chaperonin GroES (HSP10)